LDCDHDPTLDIDPSKGLWDVHPYEYDAGYFEKTKRCNCPQCALAGDLPSSSIAF
jgi:hypothetical protein